MKLIFLAAILAVAMPASAQQVYKCVKGKDVSYQSQPCADSAPVKAWDATPEPPPTNAELWRRYNAKKQGEQESAYLRRIAGRENLASGGSRPVGSAIPVRDAKNNNACEAARHQRQSVLDAIGLRRTHDLLRSLDDAVNKACK
jgi:hypothetical protein